MANVRFTATGTDKYLKVTDNLNDAAEPKIKLQRAQAGEPPFEVSVSTFDGKTGEVKIEVSRNGTDYNIHDPRMTVRDQELYPIDDSNLPPQAS
ncbi:hypothetical protein M728_004856 (plasmid) [Ensifer sp. WSM1721]|uniref:hypothetical protein n=1 Tax=Ensifer sp. WSM1721 TaxID=1041159 RepID=UPI00047E9DF8|nr:hypothetical protein [Ensifer sp. WSM1721]